MEQEKVIPSNGEQKQERKFKHFISIGVFEDGEKIVHTNAPDEIIGYGLCEFGKKGVDVHLAKQRQSKIQKPNGIVDFLRRR